MTGSGGSSLAKEGFERITALWLYPEIDCSSCVDDADDQSGSGATGLFRSLHPAAVTRSSGRLTRCRLGGESAATECCRACAMQALFAGPEALPQNLHPPVDARTGEPLNWWRLVGAQRAFSLPSPRRSAGCRRRFRSSRRSARSSPTRRSRWSGNRHDRPTSAPPTVAIICSA